MTKTPHGGVFIRLLFFLLRRFVVSGVLADPGQGHRILGGQTDAKGHDAKLRSIGRDVRRAKVRFVVGGDLDDLEQRIALDSNCH